MNGCLWTHQVEIGGHNGLVLNARPVRVLAVGIYPCNGSEGIVEDYGSQSMQVVKADQDGCGTSHLESHVLRSRRAGCHQAGRS